MGPVTRLFVYSNALSVPKALDPDLEHASILFGPLPLQLQVRLKGMSWLAQGDAPAFLENIRSPINPETTVPIPLCIHLRVAFEFVASAAVVIVNRDPLAVAAVVHDAERQPVAAWRRARSVPDVVDEALACAVWPAEDLDCVGGAE